MLFQNRQQFRSKFMSNVGTSIVKFHIDLVSSFCVEMAHVVFPHQLVVELVQASHWNDPRGIFRPKERIGKQNFGARLQTEAFCDTISQHHLSSCARLPFFF